MASARRVAEHRRRLRQQGLRPVQLWLPDTRSADFANAAKRQSLLANAADPQGGIMDWVERVGELDDPDDAR